MSAAPHPPGRSPPHRDRRPCLPAAGHPAAGPSRVQEGRPLTDVHHRGPAMSDPVTYTAVLPASDETVLFVSGLLAAERRRRGTRRGGRAGAARRAAGRARRRSHPRAGGRHADPYRPLPCARPHGPTARGGGWTCGGRASTPLMAATSRSSPPRTAGPSGPRRCGPAAHPRAGLVGEVDRLVRQARGVTRPRAGDGPLLTVDRPEGGQQAAG